MVYKFYSGNNQVPKKKRTYNYMSVLPLPNRSDRFLQPVRRSVWKPCANTGQTGPAKTEGCTLSPQVCNPPTP